uniref:GRB2 related adaptor protein a n=1 Tax=Lates calcarifer TaxID=8187 RepID=A0A4W6FZA0_LATCA
MVTGWNTSESWRGEVSTASGTSRFAPSTVWWISTEPTASLWRKWCCLRDPPSSPRLLSHPQCNPYPNPYKSSSQESLPSPRLYAHPSRPERETSQHLLEPVLGKPRLAHALCDYTPPQTAHLHFLRGDIIDLLDCSGSLTWRGRCRGRVGIFPPEYVQPLYH